MDDVRKNFEEHLESLNALKAEQDDEDYQSVFVLTRATSAEFKRSVRVAEGRIREAKGDAKVPVKKPESS